MTIEPFRHAVRSLRHDWRTTALAAGLLAVTIGAVMAIFAIVDAVLLRPLPFADQDRVTVIWQRDDRRALPIIEVAYGELLDWQARSRSFEHLGVLSSVNWNLDLVDKAEPAHAALVAVSSSFFPAVGTIAAHGRWLSGSEDAGARPTAMVISHGFWQRHFGGDPTVVGRGVPVKVNAESPPIVLTVVGIMPPGYDYPRGAEVFVPAGPLLRMFAGTGPGQPENTLKWLKVFYAVGRLRPGVDVARATQELTQVSRTRDLEGGPEGPQFVVLQPIREYLLGPAGPVLRTLLGGALLMLLIACANVAGLQVSRASRHQRALAIRAALGASPGRLTTQVLAESALLTALALSAALAVAWALLRLLLWLAPGDVPRLGDAALLDIRVLLFGAAATFVTAVLCALWPILVARRVDVLSVLAHGASVASDPRGPSDPAGRGRRPDRYGDRAALRHRPLPAHGAQPRSPRSSASIPISSSPSKSGRRPKTSCAGTPSSIACCRASRRCRTCDSAAMAMVRPLKGPIGWDNQPVFPGQPVEDPSTWGLNPHMNFVAVSPGYFETMRTPLVRGRLVHRRRRHDGARRRHRQRDGGAPAVARPGSDRPAPARTDLSHRRQGRPARRVADGRRRRPGRPFPRPERRAARPLRARRAEPQPRRDLLVRTDGEASGVSAGDPRRGQGDRSGVRGRRER